MPCTNLRTDLKLESKDCFLLSDFVLLDKLNNALSYEGFILLDRKLPVILILQQYMSECMTPFTGYRKEMAVKTD